MVIKDLKKEMIQERVNGLYEDIDRLNGELHKKEADHRSTVKKLEEEGYALIK